MATLVVRYARLLGVQLRASLLLAMQYRVEFLLDGFVEIFWMVPAIVPLAVIFDARPILAGANGEEMGGLAFVGPGPAIRAGGQADPKEEVRPGRQV